MTKLWIKIHMKSDSAIESVFPKKDVTMRKHHDVFFISGVARRACRPLITFESSARMRSEE